MVCETEQTIESRQNCMYRLIIEGACVGVGVGIMVSLLRLGLFNAETFRGKLINNLDFSLVSLAAVVLFLLVAYVAVCFFIKIGPAGKSSGIPQVIGELKGEVDQPCGTTLFCKMTGTIVAIGAGLSMGNEGPSVQVGALVGKSFSKLLKRLSTEEKLLMTCGSGAGLASAFSAPFAGVMFALEDIHGNLSRNVFISTMAAAIASDFVTVNIFGLQPVVMLSIPGALPLNMYWALIVLGIVLGATGVLYNKTTDVAQNLYAKISSIYLRIAIPFIITVPIIFLYPKTLGTGYHILEDIAGGNFVFSALLLFLFIKFIYSMICTTSGAPGGIFLPLLVIGAAIGGICFWTMDSIVNIDDLYIANFVILGMTGYFASVVRAPITGVLLITEMTGNFSNFLSLSIVALLSYVVADLMGGQPIYEQLLEKMLKSETEGEKISNKAGRHKVIIESDVIMGSRMDGKPISKMLLPKGSLVVSVIHAGRELVPNGSTMLNGGDKIAVICNQSDMYEVGNKLNNICKVSEDMWK